MNLPIIEEKDILFLENKMDEMELALPELKNFVLPGGFAPSSHCHVARCVCRRAERGVSGLEIHSEQDKLALKYLNRLSDYLFVLARTLVVQSGAEEIPWKPRIS
jgi:cob(I)alamin adenosyltransferase